MKNVSTIVISTNMPIVLVTMRLLVILVAAFCCVILYIVWYLSLLQNPRFNQYINFNHKSEELEGYSRMEFNIATTWDNQPVDHQPVKIVLKRTEDNKHVILEISAPFFNDPPAPDGEPGQPFKQLWNYEVVEAFFLGINERYLEVEFCPHGQHLLLLLNGRGKDIKQMLPVDFKAEITGNTWYGVAKIPSSYFPPGVHLFNAFAIHGSGDKRTYEALYPVQTGHFETPNFHRLEFFRYIQFERILPGNMNAELSHIWKQALLDSESH